jgi:2-oxoglutarate ferredoxin oxidoreductase subunit alpha
MVLGAAAAGVRAMTSSSSPGISLKQEGLSFLASLELPAVIVNINRGGPGLGNIAPAQGDYYQATRGGGHGDYRMPVYAPAGVQELYDITMKTFDIADIYRTRYDPGRRHDGPDRGAHRQTYKTRHRTPAQGLHPGRVEGRQSRIVKSLILDARLMEEHN